MNQSHSYTATAKTLHWLMALIWIFVWIVGILAVHGRDTFNPQHGLTILHKAVASTLLALIVIRIIWRLTHTPPALPDTMSKQMQQMAKLGHFALYVFALLGMPITGWLLSSFADKPVLFAGLFILPPLTGPKPEYTELMREIHTYMAWFCGLVVGGHILVALKHHFIDKDNVLMSMAPNHGKNKK